MAIHRLEVKPTMVSRLALALAAGLAAGLAAASGAWLVVAVVVASCAAAWVAIGRRRIVVDSTGVHARGIVGGRTLRWDEIDHYTYWSAYTGRRVARQRDPRIRGPGNSVVAMRHVLVATSKTGARIRVDSGYRGAEQVAAVIIDELHERFADRASFAPFSIESDGLHHARAGVLPWAKVETIVVDGQTPPRLQVQARGKSFAWATAPMSRVHNGLLLVERLADRGIELELGRDQLVHDRLHLLLQRIAALPRAEIVKRD